MKEKILIVGAGGFGRVVAEHSVLDYNCAFLDDGKMPGEVINGIKVIGGIHLLEKLFPEYNKILISIGNNGVREKIYKLAKGIGYTFPNIIHKSAYISAYAKIGEGCIILNNVVVQNGSKVGCATILNPGVEVHHDSEVGSFCCIYTNSVIRTYAKICDGVKIGSTVTISNECIIKNDVKDGITL